MIFAFIFISIAQAFDTVAWPYDKTLSCHKCVEAGFVFCTNGDFFSVFNSKSTVPNTICCQTVDSLTSTCLDSDNKTPTQLNYKCSNAFTSKNYALMACPHDEDRCGSQVYEFKGQTTKTEVLKKLPSQTGKLLNDQAGCTYMIKAECLAPSVTYNKQNTMLDSMVNIQIAEWNKDLVPSFDDIKKDWPAKSTDFREKHYQAKSTYYADEAYGELGLRK